MATKAVDRAYYIAIEARGVWHVSDDELLRPRCGEEMIPTLRVPVIDEVAFRGGYTVCRECDPEAPGKDAEEVWCSDALVQTRLGDIDVEAA